MKNIYSISKAQFSVIVCFLIVLELFLLVIIADTYESTTLVGLLAIIVPFVGAFYIFGWLNAHSASLKETFVYKWFQNKNWRKIFIKSGGVLLILILIGILSISYLENKQKDEKVTNTFIPIEKVENTKEYSLGKDTLTLSLGTDVSVIYYNLGSTVTNAYGFESYDPSSKTNGTYLDAQLRLENNQKFSINGILKQITLIDQEGRMYTPIKQTAGCDMDDINYFFPDEITRKLNPGIPCKVGLLFEVSKTSTSFFLKFRAY